MRNKGPAFFIFIVITICLSSNHGFAQNHLMTASLSNPQDQVYKTPESNIEWVKNATKRYSPASWNSIMEYENLPLEHQGKRAGGWVITMKKSMDTFHYLKDDQSSKAELLDRMAMNIRAVTLALQRHLLFRHTRENNLLMDWEKAEAYFIVSSPASFYVSFPLKSLFPSGKLAAEIPEQSRTALFNAYINESKTTQRFGVIGLLEEYHAHYFGSKFYVDMLEAFKIAEGSDADGFLEWVRRSQSTISAYYEFDFFIMEYLLYMKNNHPADYEALKTNRPFVETYGTLRSSYEKLVKQYLELIQSETQRFNASGKTEVGFENNVLWVRAANSNNCNGAEVLMEREKIKNALSGDRYLPILSDFPKM